MRDNAFRVNRIFFGKRHIVWGISGLLIIVFYWLSIQLSVDIPFIDDYTGIYDIVISVREAESWQERFKIVTSLHNEHRIIYTHLTSIITTWIVGRVDLRLLMFIGNLGFLGVFYIFYRLYDRSKLNWVYFLPVPFLIFQFQNFGNALWALSSLQNISVWFYGVVALYCLKDKGWRFSCAIVAAAIATYASGNGMLIWGAGGLILLLQKRWSSTAVWAVFAMLFVGLHIYFYTRAPVHINWTMAEIFRKTYVFFVGLAGCLEFTGSAHPVYAFLLGLLISGLLVGYLLLFLKNYRGLNRHTPLFDYHLVIIGILVFVLATIAGIAFVRGFITENRYKIIPLIGIVALYLGYVPYLSKLSPKRIFAVTMALTLSFYFYTFFHYFPSFTQERFSRFTMANTLRNPIGFDLPFWRRIGYLHQKGLYEYPQEVIEIVNVLKQKLVPQKISGISFEKDTLKLALKDSIRRPLNLVDDAYFILLWSEKNAYIYPANFENNNFLNFMASQQWYVAPTEAIASRKWANAGTYHIGYLQKYNGQWEAAISNDTVRIAQNGVAWLKYEYLRNNFE